MTRLFKKEEFINSHGVFINDLIGTSGNTDLERAIISNKRDKIKCHKYVVDLIDEINKSTITITALVWKNESEHKEMTGWAVELYNQKGERFDSSFPNFIDKNKESVKEYISEYLSENKIP